jgi:hypothetical protein
VPPPSVSPVSLAPPSSSPPLVEPPPTLSPNSTELDSSSGTATIWPGREPSGVPSPRVGTIVWTSALGSSSGASSHAYAAKPATSNTLRSQLPRLPETAKHASGLPVVTTMLVGTLPAGISCAPGVATSMSITALAQVLNIATSSFSELAMNPSRRVSPQEPVVEPDDDV